MDEDARLPFGPRPYLLMPVGNAYRIRREARLLQDFPALRAIRQRVFVEEQGIPEMLEWDGLDDACRHVLALTRR